MYIDQFNVGNKMMQYLLAVDEYRNITAAAAALYISQPALSKYLQNLENRLGIRLYNRIGHQLIPTWEGERLLQYAHQIYQLESRLTSEIEDWKKERGGRIRLAIPQRRSSHILPRIIPEFHAAHPNVEINLREVQSKTLEELLCNGTVDFAIVNFYSKRPEIITEELRDDEILFVVPANHPKAYDHIPGEPYQPAMLQDFSEEPFILQNGGQRTRQISDLLFEKNKIRPNIFLTTSSIDAAISMVARGCGVCFAASTYIERSTVRDKLCCFSLVDQPNCNIKLGVAYNKNIYMTHYFKDFLDIAKKNI